MRKRGVLAAAVLLAGCAFGSERALFNDHEGMAPFPDGALYDWKPSGEPDEDMVVRFVRRGNEYEIRRVGETDERPMLVLFVDVPATPEADYIAQVALDPENRDGFAYAYLWPVGDDRYRVFLQPNAFDESRELHAVEGYCVPGQYSVCTFNSAENVRRYYQEVLYPAFARGHIPATYLDMTPAAPGASGKPTAQ